MLPGCEPADLTPDDVEAGPRAIVVAVDALNEEIARSTLEPEEIPAIYGLLEGATCAEHAEPAFPSVTPASLATLWTGAYSDVSGAGAGQQHRLPRAEHTVLDRISGFDHRVLSAEPLWITGGLNGVPVAGHHVTQAPGTPAFLRLQEEGDQAGARDRREEAAGAMADEMVSVMNGYNIMVDPHRAIGPDDVTFTDSGEEGADQWEGLETLESPVPPRTFWWETGAGRIHGVLYGGAEEDTGSGPAYDRVLVNTRQAVEDGVEARAVPVEGQVEPGAGSIDEAVDSDWRGLAPHVSPALEIPVDGGTVHLRVRLFDVSADGEDFLLYQPSMHIAESNRSALREGYEEAVRGWIGNSAFALYRDGALGPTLAEGGDGLAEARYLETAELMTRQFMRGSEWIWRELEPRLLLDYFPLSDAVDHELLGYLDPEWPDYEPELASRIRDVRAQVWRLVDLRVAHLRALAEEADAGLFIAGDHGMRASWLQFRPNVALANAGLLALDEDGEVDLSRTRAVAINGYWITVNRDAWQGGIVPEAEVGDVVAEARQAVQGLLGPDGEMVVTRTFTPEEYQSRFGIGGPAGGDLYWATAPGYRSSWVRTGSAVEPVSIWAGHGFPPDEPDMHTVFCGVGPGLEPGRFPAVGLNVVAPTVAEYVGLPAPRDATGRSALDAMAGPRD